MDTYILDTSVVIKWLKKEKEEKLEEAFLYFKKLKNKEISIAVPDILFYELANFISRAPNKDLPYWQGIIDFIFSSAIKIVPPDNDFVQECYTLARKYEISAYDASYLALAQRFNTKLVTCDQKLLSASPDLTMAL